jgi:hypothetical protein
MADAAAQLFTMLTLWMLLRGRHSHPWGYGLLAGLSFGLAFFIRHPQLPLGLAALSTVLILEKPLRYKLSLLLSFGLAALMTAIPDLTYHHTAFGGWLKTESTEWFLLSVNNMAQSFFSVFRQGILRREELGFLIPFAGVGGVLLWHRYRRALFVLMAGFLGVFGFHLCYAALRPRDLIAILPVLYLFTSYGFVAAWIWAMKKPRLVSSVSILCCLVFLFARTYRSLELPWRNDVITFGYVSRSQYQAFAELSSLIPENAIVASMLNSGAIALYAQRTAIHPAPWTSQDLHRVINHLHTTYRSFYVLDDGEEMAAVLASLQPVYRLEVQGTFELPFFAQGGGNLPQSAVLYLVRTQETTND